MYPWGPIWGSCLISWVCSRKDEFRGEGIGGTNHVDGGIRLQVPSDEAFPPGEQAADSRWFWHLTFCFPGLRRMLVDALASPLFL